MSLLRCSTPRVTSAPTFSSKTACTRRRSVMHCGRPLSNPYFSSDLDSKKTVGQIPTERRGFALTLKTWPSFSLEQAHSLRSSPQTHFQPVGYWNRRCEKMLDPGSRCLMPSLVSSQFALHCRLRARFVAIRTICLSLLVGAGVAQNTEPAHTQGQQSGTSTGIAHAPVKDALSRPITAGGFVDNAPVIFSDITRAAGLDKFLHKFGTPDKSTILETPGSGVALLDYDNDGWLDIYLLNGSTFPALKGKEAPPKAMLFHNNHDGTFTDVTDKAGVANERWGFGVVVGDYDNDGWPDIYVSNFGKNRLYDHDGFLDLFVPGYVKFDPDNPPIAGKGALPPGLCQFRGINVMCGPRGLPGESDHLFHNNGDGTFTDVSVRAGVSDPRGYYGLA